VNRQKLETIAAKSSDVVLSTGGAVCLLTVLYLVYLYHWTGLREFTRPLGPYLYYGVPTLLGMFLFAARRLRPSSTKINLTLFLCSLGICIYLVELICTVWFQLPSFRDDEHRSRLATIARAQGIDFDARSRWEVIEDLRGRGQDPVPSIVPQDLLNDREVIRSPFNLNGIEFLPLAGISDRLTVVCNDSGQYLTYRSDEHGFNNPRNLWKPGIDVITIGDSFTQGWCVHDNFVALIRERYPATLNLGIGGNGPLLELATLREYAQLLKPPVVLWFYFGGNDLDDLLRERRSPLVSRYLTSGFSQGLLARQADIDRALTDYVETLRKKNKWILRLDEISAVLKKPDPFPNGIRGILTLWELRRRFGLVLGDSVPSLVSSISLSDENRLPAMEDAANLLYEILTQANKSVSEWGGRLYFVYLPANVTNTPADPTRSVVLHVAREAGLSVINMHPVLAAQKDPLAVFPFRGYGHYNQEGHRLVAQQVLRSISVADEQRR
jgi:hypothetical protein